MTHPHRTADERSNIVGLSRAVNLPIESEVTGRQ